MKFRPEYCKLYLPLNYLGEFLDLDLDKYPMGLLDIYFSKYILEHKKIQLIDQIILIYHYTYPYGFGEKDRYNCEA
jgi:hypothetical protein